MTLDYLGLIKTTLVDVPGRVASTIFTHGCPLTCSYCHNARLQGGAFPSDFLPRSAVLSHLNKRRSLIEAVCITGGEPLVHRDLDSLVSEVRALGLYVKLDTCGVFPARLQAMLSRGLIDMVALDLKCSFANYRRVGGSGERVAESLSILRDYAASDVHRAENGEPFSYELRTTVAPGVVEEEDLFAIGALVRPDERWAIAQFRPPTQEENPLRQPSPYPLSQIDRWAKGLRERHPNLIVRGV